MDELGILWAVVVFVLILLYMRYQPKRRKLPPGPMSLPVFGYYPFFRKDPVKTLCDLGKKYGGVFGIHVGPKYLVVLSDWDALEDAFSQDVFLDRPPTLFANVPYNFGVVGKSGHNWTVVRRLMSRAMKDIGLNRTRWEDLIQEEISDTIQRIVQQGKNPIEVRSFFQETFTNNIMTLALGERLHVGHPVTKEISRSVDLIMENIPTMDLRNFSPTLRWIMEVLGAEDKSELFAEIQDFTNFVSKTVDDKIKNKDKTEDSFIDLFYDALRTHHNEALNRNEIEDTVKGNTVALLAGGSESTRTSIIWLLVAMANHPEKQRRVQMELDREIGTDGVVRWADRLKVPYTFAALMESMRWMAIGPFTVLRIASQDTKIQGYDIPKGTFLTLNIWAMHSDPKYWDEPEKFRPERFLLEDGKKVNTSPKSYLPFSYGKRDCPGKLIAMMEVLQYFTTLMQKFTVTPCDGKEVKYDTLLGLTYQATNCNLCFIPRQ